MKLDTHTIFKTGFGKVGGVDYPLAVCNVNFFYIQVGETRGSLAVMTFKTVV